MKQVDADTVYQLLYFLLVLFAVEAIVINVLLALIYSTLKSMG